MARRNKFRRGERIEAAEEVVRIILSGGWIYFRTGVTHPEWAMSWDVRLINNMVRGGHLYRAEPNEETTT